MPFKLELLTQYCIAVLVSCIVEKINHTQRVLNTNAVTGLYTDEVHRIVCDLQTASDEYQKVTFHELRGESNGYTFVKIVDNRKQKNTTDETNNEDEFQQKRLQQWLNLHDIQLDHIGKMQKRIRKSLYKNVFEEDEMKDYMERRYIPPTKADRNMENRATTTEKVDDEIKDYLDSRYIGPTKADWNMGNRTTTEKVDDEIKDYLESKYIGPTTEGALKYLFNYFHKNRRE